MFYFYNTCLNSFIFFSFFGRIIIFSTFFRFSPITCFGFTILSAILFPINSPVASAALWNTFLESVFRTSSPVSNNCFLYFLTNDINPYLLTYFLVLGFIEDGVIYSCIKSTLSSTSNSLPFEQ